MRNAALIRIQYEILGIPLDTLADEYEVNVDIIRAQADREGWHLWWPNEPILDIPKMDFSNDITQIEATDADIVIQQSDEIIKRANKRLEVYAALKDFLMVALITRLESALINKTLEMVENVQVDANGMKSLANVYKDLCSKSLVKNLQNLAQDSGLATVIFQNMAGKKDA